MEMLKTKMFRTMPNLAATSHQVIYIRMWLVAAKTPPFQTDLVFRISIGILEFLKIKMKNKIFLYI
jgi:hypothetical protein